MQKLSLSIPDENYSRYMRAQWVGTRVGRITPFTYSNSLTISKNPFCKKYQCSTWCSCLLHFPLFTKLIKINKNMRGVNSYMFSTSCLSSPIFLAYWRQVIPPSWPHQATSWTRMLSSAHWYWYYLLFSLVWFIFHAYVPSEAELFWNPKWVSVKWSVSVVWRALVKAKMSKLDTELLFFYQLAG